jgi:hypothetical protein
MRARASGEAFAQAVERAGAEDDRAAPHGGRERDRGRAAAATVAAAVAAAGDGGEGERVVVVDLGGGGAAEFTDGLGEFEAVLARLEDAVAGAEKRVWARNFYPATPAVA